MDSTVKNLLLLLWTSFYKFADCLYLPTNRHVINILSAFYQQVYDQSDFRETSSQSGCNLVDGFLKVLFHIKPFLNGL